LLSVHFHINPREALENLQIGVSMTRLPLKSGIKTIQPRHLGICPRHL
jgi:hypothetical protein